MAKKPYTKVTAPYIVGREENGKVFISGKPRTHDKLEIALEEANRLHLSLDKRFLVFGMVGYSKPSSNLVKERIAKKFNAKIRLTLSEVFESNILGEI